MIRARTGAALAAVALVGVSIFGGVIIANADPGDPTFDSPSYTAQDGSDVTIGGTGTPAQVVSVSGIGGNCANLTVDALGAWTCTFNTTGLGGPNDYPMTVAFTGQLSTPAAATLTITPVPTGSISTPATGSRIRDLNPDATLTFAGTTTAAFGSTLDVEISSYDPYTATTAALTSCAPTVGVDGAWSCDIGSIPAAVLIVDLYQAPGVNLMAENTDVQLNLPPSIDNTGGTVSTTSTTNILLQGHAVPSQDGGATEISTVDVEIKTFGGDPVTTCHSEVHEYDAADNWSCTIPGPIGYDSYDLFINQTPYWSADGASNTVRYQLDVLEPAQPVSIFAPTPGSLITANSVAVNGSSGYTSGVLYVALQGNFCQATVDTTTGDWNCTVSTSTSGNYTTDSTTLAVSRTYGGTPLASESVSILRPPSVDDANSYTGTVSVSGGGFYDSEADTTIVATLSGNGITPVNCTTEMQPAVDEGGDYWDCTFAGSYPDGTYTVSVTQQPEWAGNTSAADTGTVTVAIGQGGRDILSCSTGPGSIAIYSSASGASISLYRVDPGTNYTPKNFGLCSGQAGTSHPGPFNDTFSGSCDTEGDGGSGIFGGNPSTGCFASGLTPGIWNVYYSSSTSQANWDWFFTVPTAPTVVASASPTTPGRAVFTGQGMPGDTVLVLDSDGSFVCSGLVGPSATWSCSDDVGFGSNSYRAYQLDSSSIGASAFSATTGLLTLAAPITPTPKPTTTAPPPYVPPWSPTSFVWTFTANAEGYHPGDPVTLTGAGLPSGALVDAELHSTPVELGKTIARPDGSFILNVVIPADTEPGIHHFSVTITPIGGGPSTILQPAMITVVDTGQSKHSNDGGGVPGAIGEDRNDPGAPSSFTHGLSTLRHMIVNPVVLAIAGGIGLALLLLVAFPAELLNSTIEAEYDRFAKVIPKVKAPWYTRLREWIERTPIVGGSLLILVASVIFGFADPGFGFDITSLRVVLACFIALFIVGYLAGVISARILGRAWSLDTVMEIKPLGIILTIVGVVISRLIDFSPGFLIGLLLGIALVGKPSKKDGARSVLVQSAVVLGLALLAWLAYSGLSALFEPTDFGGTLLFDTLVAVTTEGLTGLFIGLLPLRFLDGQSLFKYSKIMWAAVYAVVAFAFVAVVIPAADNWGDGGGSIALWMSIVGAFALVAVGIYVYFRFFAKPLPEEDTPEEPAAAETNEKELVH